MLSYYHLVQKEEKEEGDNANFGTASFHMWATVSQCTEEHCGVKSLVEHNFEC